MKLTNKYSLPQPIEDAVKYDWYDSHNTISATSLLKPPRQNILQSKHFEEIEEDVSERLWALYGHAVHSILEKHYAENSLQEERLTVEIGGKIVSGKIDLYNGTLKKLSDYKFQSVWKWRMDEWDQIEEQLNIYAYILESNRFPVKEIEAIMLFRDWSKTESIKSGYPDSPIKTKKLNLWDFDKREKFILSKLSETDRDCTRSERWERGECWAIYKGDNKKAFKLHDTLPEAEKHIEELGKGYSIVHRPGKSIRCEDYCNVKNFCPQYKESICQQSD